ncbi:hypothetical protein ACLB1Q_33810 [Escherichia coli]
MYGKAIGSYDATLNLFIMNELRNGASKYKTPLGLASDMQLFEGFSEANQTTAFTGPVVVTTVLSSNRIP